MRTWKFIALGLIALTAAGCRSDPAVAMLERDNREKEDEIYHLRFRLQELEDQLHDAAPADVRPRRQYVPEDASPESSPGRPTPAPRTTTDRPRALPRENGPALQGPGALDIQLPDQPMQPGVVPDTIKPRSSSGPLNTLPSNSLPLPSDAPAIPNATPSGIPGILPGAAPGATPANPSGGGSGWYRRELPADPVSDARRLDAAPAKDRPLSTRVAQITLNESLTGGIGNEMTLSDHGLLVVVEPRDINGAILDAPGAISAVLYDTALPGEAARVGRWDFTAAETSALLRPSPDHGIHLTLPWKSGPPEHAKLKLFVRYKTQDGRKLQVERPVVVALAQDAAPQHAIPLPPVERGIIEPEHTARGPQRPVWSPDRPY